MRILVGFIFVMGFLAAEEAEKSYVLAEEHWEPPVGVKAKVVQSREMPKGKAKWTTDGSWTTGRIGSLIKSEFIGFSERKDLVLLKYLDETNHWKTFHDGEVENSTTKGVFHEKTIKVSREEGKWTAKLVDADIEEVEESKREAIEQRLSLLEEDFLFDYGPSLYGTQPRKVGESWEVEKPNLPSMGNGEVLEGEASVVFEKVEEWQGVKCAVLTFKSRVKVKQSSGTLIEFEGKGRVVRSLSSFFDHDLKMEGKSKVTYFSKNTSSEYEGKTTLQTKVTILPNEDEEPKKE